MLMARAIPQLISLSALTARILYIIPYVCIYAARARARTKVKDQSIATDKKFLLLPLARFYIYICISTSHAAIPRLFSDYILLLLLLLMCRIAFSVLSIDIQAPSREIVRGIIILHLIPARARCFFFPSLLLHKMTDSPASEPLCTAFYPLILLRTIATLLLLPAADPEHTMR